MRLILGICIYGIQVRDFFCEFLWIFVNFCADFRTSAQETREKSSLRALMARGVRIEMVIKCHLIRTKTQEKALMARGVRIEMIIKCHLIRTKAQKITLLA